MLTALPIALALLLSAAAPPPAEAELLEPLPRTGALPPLAPPSATTQPVEVPRRVLERGYRSQIGAIRHRFFGERSDELREQGIAELRQLVDPIAFMPMIEILRREVDEVRLAMLDHFAACGDDGQAALAWVAIHDDDAALRNEATQRLTAPAADPVLRVLDGALRSDDHDTVSHAAMLTATLGVLEAIPLLIAGQVVEIEREEAGDLAWIAVQKQTVYVRSIQAVVGNGSAAFLPVPGVLTEGFVLRVQDAVVVIYRGAVHHALLALTSPDWGSATADLGFDKGAWLQWYNDQYVPWWNEQVLIARMAE